jgi:hypothetical protein
MLKFNYCRSIWLTAVCFMLLLQVCKAADRFWVGPAGGAFNGASNWSTASGGAGGASVPGANDRAIFDGGANRACTLTAAASVQGIWIKSTYTQTLSTGASNFAVTAGSAGVVIEGGTLTANASTITISGPFTLTAPGIFNYLTSTVVMQSTASITGTPTFYNFTFSPTGTGPIIYTVVNSITVTNIYRTQSSITMEVNTGTINIQKDATITNSGAHTTGGTATLIFNGTGTQSFSGSATVSAGLVPNVTINKSAGTLTISGTIAAGGNWTYQAGTVSNSATIAMNHPVSSGNTTLQAANGPSSMSFSNLTIRSQNTTSGSCLLGSNITITGTLTISTNGRLNGQASIITLNGGWSNTATWVPGTSTVILAGSSAISIDKTSAGNEVFNNLTINKSTVVAVTLNKAVDVSGVLTLTNGLITSSSTNILSLTATGTSSGGSNTSYVNGPMGKTGTSAFVFPLGKSSVTGSPYHPLGISVPATSTQFTAEYFGVGQASGSAKAATINTLSSCEYWTIQRNSGTATVTPTLNWNANCAVTNYSELTVAAWNGSIWNDLTSGTLNASSPQGSLQAGTSITFSGTTAVPLVLATKVMNQSFATASKDLTPGYYNTNGNVLWFRYDEQYADANGLLTYRIVRLSDNATVTLMSNASTTAVPVALGTNQYKMDLYTAGNTPLAAGMYVLEITNEKNEVFRVRFNKN